MPLLHVYTVTHTTCNIIVTNTRLISILFQLHAVSSVQCSSSTTAPTDACEPIPLAKQNDSVGVITLIATVSNCFVPRLSGAHALRGILTETVFERSASVDIILVSDGVTVTVERKQQVWTKQSLPQRYLCEGCQLKSDQAIRSQCLKGHVRARGSTL